MRIENEIYSHEYNEDYDIPCRLCCKPIPYPDKTYTFRGKVYCESCHKVIIDNLDKIESGDIKLMQRIINNARR
jgi:hypothetical protein